MSEFLYEVGDEYEGSPIQQSRFISEVLQYGGLVGIDGNIVRILYLPGKGSIFDEEEVVPTPEPVTEEKLEKAAELISEYNAQAVIPAVAELVLHEPPAEGKELSPAEDLADVEVAVVEEAPKPAPKPRGRKPAVKPTET